MKRRFEIYADEAGTRIAVSTGFSPIAFLLGPIWILLQRLWIEGATVLIAQSILAGVLYVNQVPWTLHLGINALFGLAVGFYARHFRELSAERRGFGYVCTIQARDGATAIAMLAQVGGQPLPEWRARYLAGVPDIAPKNLRAVFAVAILTLKAAIRYRFVVVLLALLIAAVFILPGIIKHDGTATGFSQILLAYTLTAITGLLGFSSLWLACGTLARDIEDMSSSSSPSNPFPAGRSGSANGLASWSSTPAWWPSPGPSSSASCSPAPSNCPLPNSPNSRTRSSSPAKPSQPRS